MHYASPSSPWWRNTLCAARTVTATTVTAACDAIAHFLVAQSQRTFLLNQGMRPTRIVIHTPVQDASNAHIFSPRL